MWLDDKGGWSSPPPPPPSYAPDSYTISTDLAAETLQQPKHRNAGNTATAELAIEHRMRNGWNTETAETLFSETADG